MWFIQMERQWSREMRNSNARGQRWVWRVLLNLSGRKRFGLEWHGLVAYLRDEMVCCFWMVCFLRWATARSVKEGNKAATNWKELITGASGNWTGSVSWPQSPWLSYWDILLGQLWKFDNILPLFLLILGPLCTQPFHCAHSSGHWSSNWG